MQSKICLHITTSVFGWIVKKSPMKKSAKKTIAKYMWGLYLCLPTDDCVVSKLGKAERKSKYKGKGVYIYCYPHLRMCADLFEHVIFTNFPLEWWSLYSNNIMNCKWLEYVREWSGWKRTDEQTREERASEWQSDRVRAQTAYLISWKYWIFNQYHIHREYTICLPAWQIPITSRIIFTLTLEKNERER